MAKTQSFSIPDEKGNILQLNSGDTIGNVYSTFGMDFDDTGKIKVSEQVKVFFDGVSEATFSNKILGFVKYINSGVEKIVSFGGGKVHYFTVDSYSLYTIPSGIAPTNTSNDDGAFFDSLILISDTNTIKSSTTGSGWVNWWETTLGQTALASSSLTEPRLMRVGATGYLYISDNGNKIYLVKPTGSTAPLVVKTGDGTLDFSVTNHTFWCMEPTSTRMWIGTKNIGGEAVIIEWDMSVSASTANRIHNVGAEAVMAIVIEDDTPIAILSDGNTKIFDGFKFVDYEKMKIRVPQGYKLASNFMHRNGWDIIDGKPHIAITGQISSSDSKYTRSSLQEWAMPSGVYCMDRDKGLYHRFAFGSGDATRTNYGEVAATDVGALVAIDSNTGKFLVSYETMLTDTTYNPALAYHVRDNSIAGKGWLATTFAMSYRQMWNMLEIFHKPLETGCSIKVYSRPENTDGINLTGTWLDTTTFNLVGIGHSIVKGDLALVKMGNGAGQWIKVASVTESATVTSVKLDTANSFVTAGNMGTLEILNFKYMGTIDDTTKDFHDLAVPSAEKKRRRQFLFEFTQPASTRIDLDYVLVTP